MDTNTVQLIQQAGNKLDGYIQTIAQKAGETTQHFWPVFVKQQEINGWVSLIEFIFCIVGLGIFLSLFLKGLKKCSIEENESAVTVGTILNTSVFCILTVIFLVSTFVNGSNLSTTIGQITNPEYSAVQNLISMIKN